jgi:hypothetical protein
MEIDEQGSLVGVLGDLSTLVLEVGRQPGGVPLGRSYSIERSKTVRRASEMARTKGD